MKKLLTILCLFVTLFSQGQALQQATFSNGPFFYQTVPGLVSLPDDYNDSVNKKYPILIFLHGHGEGSSTRNDALLKSASLPYLIDHGQVPKCVSAGKTVKFIVACPQYDLNTTIGQYNHQDVWNYFINGLLSTYRVDPSRIYVSGYSGGAEGAVSGCTWNPQAAQRIAACYVTSFTGFLNQPPEQDSAASMGKRYRVKLHAIYGSADTLNSTNGALKTVQLITIYNSLTPSPLAFVTRLPGVGHDGIIAFDTAFRTNVNNVTSKNVYEWLYQYQSTPPPDPNLTELPGVKIPITTKYVWQDNSQQDRADKLVNGDTLVNYSPARPIIYTTHEVVFDLWDWSARVTGVKMFIANSDTCTVDIIMEKTNSTQVSLGTFHGGANQHFVYASPDTVSTIAKIIFRSSSSNYQFGSEIEVWGHYINPSNAPPKAKAPLGQMSGAVDHSYDHMNPAKIAAIESLGITNLRTWENGYEVTDGSNSFRFEPELGTDRYSTDSAFGILHRWKPSIYTWKAITGQWTPQKNSWNVIDNFPNRYIRGTVTNFINHGSWGEVWMNISAVSQPTEYLITLWYVYKGGALINVTQTPEYFSSSLLEQTRHFNVGGGLSISVGDVLTFYKSQESVNPIYFGDNDLPRRDLDSAHLLTGQNMNVYARRGGKNTAVANYPLQSPAQRLLKGAGIYSGVEPFNEANGWWTNWLGFWNGKTIFHGMNMAYDGFKKSFPNTGAKQADSTIDVICGGLATQFTDQLYGIIEEARRVRGYLPDGTIDVPFTAVNIHIYPSAGGQYGYGNNGGLPWESIRSYVQDFVNLIQRRIPHTKLYITEWGWDQNVGSPLHAGAYGPYTREIVGAMWMVRGMFCMEVDGVDRATYYPLFQDWPESVSNNSTTQFGTMRLLRQLNDGDANTITRSPQGDYMAQYNNTVAAYTYSDSVATGSPWLHAYKFATTDSTKIALWSEEITSIVNDTTAFAERKGTITLNIPAGNYNIRQFQDNGSTVMSKTTSTSTGSVTFNYSAKPIIIEYSNAALPPPPPPPSDRLFFKIKQKVLKFTRLFF